MLTDAEKTFYTKIFIQFILCIFDQRGKMMTLTMVQSINRQDLLWWQELDWISSAAPRWTTTLSKRSFQKNGMHSLLVAHGDYTALQKLRNKEFFTYNLGNKFYTHTTCSLEVTFLCQRNEMNQSNPYY